jgi:AcrR family transcriptional regulator
MNMFIIEPVQEERQVPRAEPARPTARAGAAAPAGLRERNKREKLLRIRRAARELFARKGFAATTAREIAARARVATGTLFLYARDKRELLFLVFAEEARRLLAEADAAFAARPDAGLVDSLMDLFGRFLDFYAGDPELSAAIVAELFSRPYEPERLGSLTREYAERVVARVERAQARGEVRTDVPAPVVAGVLFAHYAHWTQAWLLSRLLSREQAGARLREALRLGLEGLHAPAPGSRRRRP